MPKNFWINIYVSVSHLLHKKLLDKHVSASYLLQTNFWINIYYQFLIFCMKNLWINIYISVSYLMQKHFWINIYVSVSYLLHKQLLDKHTYQFLIFCKKKPTNNNNFSRKSLLIFLALNILFW